MVFGDSFIKTGEADFCYRTTIYPVADLLRKEMREERVFEIATKCIAIGRSSKIAKIIPNVGHKVFTKYNRVPLFLKEAIMTDHISVTYSTDYTEYYAKIYTSDALHIDMIERKAERMIQEKVEISGVCWPIDMIIDNAGCFVGILVPVSKGVQLTRSILNGSTGLSQFFPQWNKTDLCVLTISILKKICKMHALGLMFGCINPASIYVENAGEVYFVDTDGWQIEDFPAFSQNQTFTPPEIMRDNRPQLLYTLDQENYQVAVLTFMLMMPGKFPYAKGKNVSEQNSIMDMSFPFSVGGGMLRSEDAERPSGIWRIVWDHLPYKMCESFYNTFHSKGKYSSPGYRLDVKEWLRMTEEYESMLKDSKRADSRSMFPRTFRRDGKRAFVRCNICGQEHPEFYFIHNIRVQKEKINIWERGYRICIPCANGQSDVFFTCQCCGRQFYYTNRTKVLHEIGKSEFDFKNQKWCKDCKRQTIICRHCGKEVPVYQIKEFEDRRRNLRMSVCGNCFRKMIEKSKQERAESVVWKNSVDHWVICRNCGRSFPITNGDMEYFSRKGYNLPTRCPNCRKIRY